MNRIARVGVWGVLSLGLVGTVVPAVMAQEGQQQTEKKAPAKAPVDFRKLKAWLPEKLAELPRGRAQAQRTKIGEFSIATADATYEKENDESDEPKSVRVNVTDYGAAPEMAEAMAAWSEMDVDSESDTGYQRTTKISGFPAYEQYDTENKDGELTIYVANRFIVQVNSDHLTQEEFQKLGGQLGLDKLAALKE